MDAIQFVLASRSPRRVQFLREAGFAFHIDPADVPEIPAPGEAAADYALRVAIAKASAAQQRHPALPCLGADTDVVLAGRILGKPADAAEAEAMLAALSGQTHQVISAVALLHAGQCYQRVTTTEIIFAELSRETIAGYVASGEPMGKAGAYAIQGLAARFVREVRGSYTGVVGLPMSETCALLAHLGIQPRHASTIPL
ncbi:MAG: nucleoside triphosphate pyrophosphatase [Pseudomonadota bacterium]